MVQQIPGFHAPTTARRPADPLADLNRLLARLQQTVLRADAEREKRLRTSEFERRRVATNINYARSLLTKAEQDALAVKVHARRSDMQADLIRKRDVLDQLVERLHDLEDLATHEKRVLGAEDGGDGLGSDEEEDILSIIMASSGMSVSNGGKEIFSRADHFEDGDQEDDWGVDDIVMPSTLDSAHAWPPEPTAPPSTRLLQDGRDPSETIVTSQTLRPRRPEAVHSAQNAASSTSNSANPTGSRGVGASTTTATNSALFGARTTERDATGPTSATTEAILEHQRAEQDALSASILSLARDLKASSEAMAVSLDEDRELVERTSEGLEKTESRLKMATRRMGMLRRLTEGKGWLGRMQLYAMVYGLMVVLVLVVFALPKLRF